MGTALPPIIDCFNLDNTKPLSAQYFKSMFQIVGTPAANTTSSESSSS